MSFKNTIQAIPVLLRSSYRYRLYKLHGLLHDYVTVNTKQGRITMSTKDIGIAKNLFKRKEYEWDYSCKAIQFLKENNFIPKKDVCMIDVGANIGIISTGLILSGDVQNSIAVEPEPNNFALLKKNVQQNGLRDKILCLQLALGDEASTLEMELSPENLGDHRIRIKSSTSAPEFHNESTRSTIHVDCITLDELLNSSKLSDFEFPIPSLLWIDIQGYEGHVFEGGKNFLKSEIPVISEIWPYGLLRSGYSLDQFTSLVSETWDEYWIFRRDTFINYPTSNFDRYLNELGIGSNHENVIFTNLPD